MEKSEKWLSLKEASQSFGKSERTIRNYISKGKLIGKKIPTKGRPSYKILESSLRNLLEEVSNVKTLDLEIPIAVPKESEFSYKILFERSESEKKEWQERAFQLQEYIGNLQAKLENERKLLTDRAQSLIEKEARAKELEAKLLEEEVGRKEIAIREEAFQKQLDQEKAKRAEIETMTGREIEERESQIRRFEEESEKLRQALQLETEEKKKFEEKLLEAQKPWWKKIFG